METISLPASRKQNASFVLTLGHIAWIKSESARLAATSQERISDSSVVRSLIDAEIERRGKKGEAA